jgi:hypothetical protein
MVEMYVFSNNYSLGGTILSGMIGAYIGYKVGRAKPQKKGFETEKKIGRKVKGAFSKKKMARGGGVSDEKVFEAQEDGILGVYSGFDAYTIEISKGDRFATFGKQDNANWWFVKKINVKPISLMLENTFDYNQSKSNVPLEIWQDLVLTFPKGENSIYAEMKEVFADGGGVSYNKNWEVVGVTSNGKMFKERITLGRMSDKEDVKNALNRRTDLNIREITSIKEVFAKGGSTYQGGGEIKNYFKKNLEIVKSDKPDSFGEDYYVIRDKKDKAHYVEGGYWYIVQNLKERGFTSNKEVSDMIKNAKEVSGIKTFAKGGEIGFKALSNKVAKRYEGKAVAPKYQGEYGKRYSKSEAKEVGDKVAGKVYWAQKNKMALGGKAKGVEWMKSDGQYEAELGDLYLIISPATERGLYQVRVKKGYRGETIGVSTSEINGLDKAKDLAYDIAGDYYKQFAQGGGVEKDSNYYEIIRKIENNERMLKNTYGRNTLKAEEFRVLMI